MEQYPLIHNFSSQFALGATSATKGATIIPLIRFSENATGAEAIEVNPRNGAFAEETGMTTCAGSIIPRLNFSMTAFIPEAAIATGVRHINFKFMPIYTSFLSSLDAANDKDDVDVEAILELTHSSGSKYVTPIYAAKLFATLGSVPLATVTDADEAITHWGLTTDATYEGVAFNEELLYDMLSYGTNKGMLSKSIGPIRTAQVRQDRPWHFSSKNFTYPAVKRQNPYTFCGVMVWVPQAGTSGQSLIDAEITDIAHLQFNYRCRYEEWNPNFDQVAI